MSYEELTAHLFKEGDDRIQLMRSQAEAEAEKIRDDTAKSVELIREGHERRLKKAVKEQEDDILSAAKRRSRAIILLKGKSLADRLISLCITHLSELRSRKNYADIFESLIRELPPVQWKEVMVNPADIDVARKYFPDALITPDKTITGGVTVMTEDRKIRITNTFEKRLERAWEDLAPLLIRDVYKEV